MRLYELNHIAASVIGDSFPEPLWVEGELYEGRVGGGGHYYGELVEKTDDGVVAARARITVWARNWQLLSMRFQKESGQTLHAGLRLRLLVEVGFHEAYGYSLNVQDIDARYTLGDQMQRRREILRQLEEDGILNDNRALPLARLVQRIAVISSPTAAGLGDFEDQLHGNEYGLAFRTKLFPALMQGEQAPESIIAQLTEIDSREFDCVVIIRGGGATADLSDFDHYALASCIAQCPLPVIVGIGHERDETVLDHVAHLSLKTPTAVAAFLIERQASELALLEDLRRRIPQSVRTRLMQEHHRMDLVGERLPAAARRHFERLHHRLELTAQRLRSLDPQLLLERGYSITTCAGRLVRDVGDLREGEIVTTRLASGEIYSTVNTVVRSARSHLSDQNTPSTPSTQMTQTTQKKQ